MAGNTKLRGFTPDGKVQLERWGSSIIVEVSKDSLTHLRDACFTQLPKKPPKQTKLIGDMDTKYDSNCGRVNVSMTPHIASLLSEFLSDMLKELDEPSISLTVITTLSELNESLLQAVEKHKEYISIDEPGVKNG